MNTPDTVTHPPNIPRGLDPHTVVNKADVEVMIETRLRAYDDDRRRMAAEQHLSDVRQRMLTYGVSGVAGLVTGIGATLLVQRIRRGRGGAMKP